MNSGLTSADSGNPVGSGGSRYTVSQRRSGPRGLFSLAEDKVKLSDDVIEVACTRSATVVHLYYHALCNPLSVLPHESPIQVLQTQSTCDPRPQEFAVPSNNLASQWGLVFALMMLELGLVLPLKARTR